MRSLKCNSLCLCVYVCLCLCSLEDGGRLPWQQLERCMDFSDGCVCVCACVRVNLCSHAGGQIQTTRSHHFMPERF